MAVEVDEFIRVGGAAGELGEEFVDGSAAGRFDVAARAEGSDGPLRSCPKEHRADKILADLAIIDFEVSFQVAVVIAKPAEEDADELELVDVFGRVGACVRGCGTLRQVPVIGGAAGDCE